MGLFHPTLKNCFFGGPTLWNPILKNDALRRCEAWKTPRKNVGVSHLRRASMGVDAEPAIAMCDRRKETASCHKD